MRTDTHTYTILCYSSPHRIAWHRGHTHTHMHTHKHHHFTSHALCSFPAAKEPHSGLRIKPGARERQQQRILRFQEQQQQQQQQQLRVNKKGDVSPEPNSSSRSASCPQPISSTHAAPSLLSPSVPPPTPRLVPLTPTTDVPLTPHDINRGGSSQGLPLSASVPVAHDHLCYLNLLPPRLPTPSNARQQQHLQQLSLLLPKALLHLQHMQEVRGSKPCVQLNHCPLQL